MSDGVSSTFSLREFLQLLVPPVVALSLFTPLYPPLQGKVTIEGILFAGVLLGLLFSGPAGAVSTFVTKLIPSVRYHKRMNEVDATGRLMRRTIDFERLETHLSKDDREIIDILASLSICYRHTAMYLVFFILANAFNLWTAIRWSAIDIPVASLAAWPDPKTIGSAWNAILEPATPMLGGWNLSTAIAILASLPALTFLLKESLDTKEALFGVQGLYNGYSLKLQKQDPAIARAIWGKVLRNRVSSKDAVVVLSAIAADGSKTQLGTTSTDKHGLFCIGLDSPGSTPKNYEISVDDAETVLVSPGAISGLMISLKPQVKRTRSPGRLLFSFGFKSQQGKRDLKKPAEGLGGKATPRSGPAATTQETKETS